MSARWRFTLVQAMTLASAIALAGLLFVVAARNFRPGESGGGVAGSALASWQISENVQPFGQIARGFDLAGQVGVAPALLVLGAALNSAGDHQNYRQAGYDNGRDYGGRVAC